MRFSVLVLIILAACNQPAPATSQTGDTGGSSPTPIFLPNTHHAPTEPILTDVTTDTGSTGVTETGLEPVPTGDSGSTDTGIDGVDACAAGQSRLAFVYHSEPGATGVQLSTEMNNFGMNVVAEGAPAGWHLTSVTDPLTTVTTLTASNDTCTLDTTLWQASASFNGGWSCMGGVAPFATHGTWEVSKDGVPAGTIYVQNGLGGCELQVN